MTDEITAARQAAHRLWRAWREEQSPPDALVATDVAQICTDLDVGVEYFSSAAQPGTFGYLDTTDDLIWLRDGLPLPVERFTLAHELGHWVLHRDYRAARTDCAEAEIADALESEHEALLRPAEAYSPRSRREREANTFAAELLAPLDLVRRAYLGLDGAPPRTTEQIAAALGISKSVVVAQLEQLLAGTAPIADAPEGERAEHHARSAPPPSAASALDASQQAAVAAPAPALVVACPGTGKTSTLVARVRWLVEHGAKPASILALTFSRKATEELQGRISVALGTATPAELPTIATFHQFCGDLLRSYGYLVGLRPDYRLIDDVGAFFVLRDLGSRLPLNHYASLTEPTQYFGALLRAIGKAKDELVEPERYRELADAIREPLSRERALEVAAVYALYQAELERRQDADYADLIRLVVRLFAEHPDVLASVRETHAHLLVDEFQDINRANGVLLRHLAGPEGNIWAVGDANQAIYRFRGASPVNLATFRDDYPRATVLPLDQNYRSRPQIVATANYFAATELQQGEPDALVELHATRPDAPDQVQAWLAPDGLSEIAAVISDIQRRRAAGATWSDFAVLCRTRAIARQFALALNAAGIPAEAQTDLFNDERIKDVLGIAHLLAGEQGGLLRAARIPAHRLSRAAVQAVLAAQRTEKCSLSEALDHARQAKISPADRRALARLGQIMPAMRRAPTVAGALAAYLCDLTALAREHLLAPDATAGHLAELLALAGRFDQERGARAGEDAEETAGQRWRTFMAFLRAVRNLPRESAPAGESAGEQVRVLTVHGAKGLEWPVVYLPHLVPGTFPSSGRYDAAPPPPGLIAGASRNPKTDQQLEEACLFYVALTRARDTLILSRAARYGKRNANPSPFFSAALRGSGLEPQRLPAMAPRDEDDAADLAPSAGDPAFTPPQALTESEIATYDRCPRQYAYRYGYHFAGGHNLFGRLRRAVNDGLRAGRTDGDAERAVAAFEAAWQADAREHAVADAEPFDELYRRHGRQAVAQALPHVRAPADASAEAFARTVDVVIADTIIRVELDRTEAEGGSAPRRVVRHRIGRRSASTAGATLNTYLSVLAQRTLSGDPEADAIFEHDLSAGEMAQVRLTPKEEADLRQKIVAAVQGIRAADFPAHPDDRRCATCEFALICPV